MHRFFVDESQVIEDKIYIKGNDVKHIKDVLRLRNNEVIEISCKGTTYSCVLEVISKDKVVANINNTEVGKNESTIEIALFQGLSKGNKMELIFQKGTEIGVKHFYPVATHRSVVKIKDIKKEQNKVERWNAIVEEAAKQSKRDLIPRVNGIMDFQEMIDLLKDQANIIVPYEDEKVITIREGLEHLEEGRINIIIGPEGGFEPSEIEKLKAINSKVVTLGPRILRTETAGLVASTIVLYEAGNLGVI